MRSVCAACKMCMSTCRFAEFVGPRLSSSFSLPLSLLDSLALLPVLSLGPVFSILSANLWGEQPRATHEGFTNLDTRVTKAG